MTLLIAAVGGLAVYLLVSGLGAPRAPRVPRVPRSSDRVPLETRLRQAGVSLSPSRYRATVAGSAVTAVVVVGAVTSNPAIGVLAAGAVAAAPRAFYRRRREQRLAARSAAWPEAIRDVLTHLAVDQTLHRALVELGRSGPEPLRPVWKTYALNATVIDVPAALAQVRADLADPISDHVCEALEAAHDRGTRVVIGVLRALAEHVTLDLQTREQIITAQTETRAQAVMAVALPFAVLGYLAAVADEFGDFYGRPIGWVVIAIGAGMATIGWQVITALGRIPADPRVLARREATP